MDSKVVHRGKVVAVHDTYITVDISPDTDECQGCAIAGICSKGETVDVRVAKASPSLLGHEVEVAISGRSHRRALMLFFAVPLILLMAALALCFFVFDLSESLSSVIALSIVAVWYCIIMLQSGRIKTDIEVISE